MGRLVFPLLILATIVGDIIHCDALIYVHRKPGDGGVQIGGDEGRESSDDRDTFPSRRRIISHHANTLGLSRMMWRKDMSPARADSEEATPSTTLSPEEEYMQLPWQELFRKAAEEMEKENIWNIPHANATFWEHPLEYIAVHVSLPVERCGRWLIRETAAFFQAVGEELNHIRGMLFIICLLYLATLLLHLITNLLDYCCAAFASSRRCKSGPTKTVAASSLPKRDFVLNISEKNPVVVLKKKLSRDASCPPLLR